MLKTIPLTRAPYDSRIVANTFISIGKYASLEPLNSVKIQKLVFIAHGFYLAYYSQPLVRETIQAWPYGPVIPILHNEWKHDPYGPLEPYHPRGRSTGFRISIAAPTVSENDTKFAREIWRVFGPYSGEQLSTLTRESGTPWDMIYNGEQKSSFEGRPAQAIPNALIREYYLRLVQKQSSASE